MRSAGSSEPSSAKAATSGGRRCSAASRRTSTGRRISLRSRRTSAWFGWRTSERAEHTATASYRSAEWAAEEHRARQSDSGFVPSLVPVLEGRYLDVRDDSIWRLETDDDGLDVLVRTEMRGLASVLSELEAPYAARRGSPWRRFRVEATSSDEPWTALDRVPDLDGPVGTAVIAGSGTGTWIRTEIVLCIDASPARFVRTTCRVRHPFDDEQATDATVHALRYAFGEGDASLGPLTDSDASESLSRALKRRGADMSFVRRGRIEVWRQPSIDELLRRLPLALASVSPRISASLAAGARSEQLDAFENDIGMPLPEDLRALWALANGQRAQHLACGEPLFWGFVLMSVEEARQARRTMVALAADQFGERYWDEALVPYLDRRNGDLIAVDVGGAYGPAGCVVDMNHERPERCEVVYDSVTEWLECFVEGVERGIYVESPDGGIFPREFIAEGSFEEIRRHEAVRSNGRYPWERRR